MKLIAVIALLLLISSSAIAQPKMDWSVAVVESTMKRYPAAKDLGSWEYSRSLYLYGQYLVYKRTHEPRYLKYIIDWVDLHVDDQGVVRSPNEQGEVSEVKFDNLDSMLPGNLLLLLYEETKAPKYKLAAERIRRSFDKYPRTKEDGFWHAAGLESQLWADGVFMSLPFLVRYGSMFGDSKYANDEAVLQLLVYSNHLSDLRTGLMFHAYDDSGKSPWANKETKLSAERWGRAMGWFGMTLIEVLELLPRDHPMRPMLVGQVFLLVKALARYQDEKTGLWYQVVDKGDDARNWLETSSSSMFTYVTAMAVDRGYVEPKYASGVKRGYAGMLTKISLDKDGQTNLTDICEGTGVADLAYYFARKRNTNDFHGLGAFLIMNEKFMNETLKGSSKSLWQPTSIKTP